MKYKIGNGIEAEGTPAEIAEFLQLRNYKGSVQYSATPTIPPVQITSAPAVAKPAKRVYKLSDAQRKKNRDYQRQWIARRKAKVAQARREAEHAAASVIALPANEPVRTEYGAGFPDNFPR